MRKVRDYNAELKALEDKARGLKARRVEQLGQLVTSTGADTLDMETLAGVLLNAVKSQDADEREGWRASGAAFFQRRGRKGARKTDSNGNSGAPQPGANPAPGSGATAD